MLRIFFNIHLNHMYKEKNINVDKNVSLTANCYDEFKIDFLLLCFLKYCYVFQKILLKYKIHEHDIFHTTEIHFVVVIILLKQFMS